MLQSGYTMMHEHVTIDLSGVKKDPDCRLDCKDQTIEEFRALKDLGVGNVLEVTNLGMGRDVDYIMDVAKASGINILVCTGFYKEPFLPDYVYTSSEEELADLMVAEIEEGIGKSGVKASAIGEFGTSKGRMTDMECKVFRSCAMAARRTGRLVTTHTTLGTLGIEQADYLISMGLDPSRIVIGHMDLSNDISMILSLLERGVSIGFDTVGKLDYAPDSFRLEALRAIFDKGFQDQVVLSMDITRKSHLKANGGLGYSYLFTSFVPYLMANGFTRQDVDRLLVDNPARLLGGDA